MSDLLINGYGNFSGGTFEKVRINGLGKVNGGFPRTAGCLSQTGTVSWKETCKHKR